MTLIAPRLLFVRRFFIALLIIVSAAASTAQAQDALVEGMPSGEYQLDLTHASVVWKLSHFGFSTYVGRFADFDVALNLDSPEFSKSTLGVDIKIASVQSAYPRKDESDVDFDNKIATQFLNAKEHPSILFKSKSVSELSDNKFTIQGDLTMNGQTHPVTLDAVLNKSVLSHPLKKTPAIGFSAITTIDRTTWGVDKYVPAVGAEVKIEIEAEFLQKSAD